MVQANESVRRSPDAAPPAGGRGQDPALDDVLRALFRVGQQLKQTADSDTVERHAITILSRLRENGSIRLSDLTADLMVDISTVSPQIRALEDRGLVTRSDDPDDRRAVRRPSVSASTCCHVLASTRRPGSSASTSSWWAPGSAW